jgi:predicted HicB family RNase H-like nuclease
MEALLPIILQAAAPAIGSLLSGLAAWALLSVQNYVKSKTQNEAINQALAQICTLVETIVKELEQTLVPIYKQRSGSNKLFETEAEAIRRIALNKIKAQLPAAAAQMAGLAVNSLDDFIKSKIEQAVQEMK